MKILITGASGRLGTSLRERIAAHYPDDTAIAIDHAQLDITDDEAVRAEIGAARPDVVIHAAAWTAVDACALDPQKAVRINGYGAQNVALAAAACGADVVYISSNEVFDGRAGRSYMEYDAPNPINPYGYSKWVGEQTTARATGHHYIVRASWLFAHGGANFAHVVLRAAAVNKPMRVVMNEVANPTYTDDLAEAVLKLIRTERYGIYHLVNEGACSRLDLARHILERIGSDLPLQAITANEWPRASRPPEQTALANIAGSMIGITLRDWRAAVDAFLERERTAGSGS